jgi:hypothetical protein
MLIRQLFREFDPVYIKPTSLAGAVNYLLMPTLPLPAEYPHGRPRGFDRRLGERRQRRAAVLLDLRSPHARRHVQARRLIDHPSFAEPNAGQDGIDVYA